MLQSRKKVCPYCGTTFRLSVRELFNSISRKQAGPYCPHCFTGADFRFGVAWGFSFALAIAIGSVLLFRLPVVVAILILFVLGFVVAPVACAAWSPLKARAFEQWQFEKRRKAELERDAD